MGMLGMLLTYDDDYNVIGTLDLIVLYEPDGVPSGILDMAAYEASGGEWTAFRRVFTIDAEGKEHQARGAKVWPEWIGGRAHEFRVEVAGPPGQKHIATLVHKDSGHRRERSKVEGAIASRIAEKQAEADRRTAELRAAAPKRRPDGRFARQPDPVAPEPADIRDLVGGPERPLILDDQGKTAKRRTVPLPDVPLVAVPS